MSTVSLRTSHATLAALRPVAPVGRPTLATWLVELLLSWQERLHQRRQLRSLSDHMLHDIGLGRGDVEAEASKPFWRP